MKTIFEIGNKEDKGAEDALLFEWGHDYCCAAHFDKEANRISWLQYNEKDETTDTVLVQDLIDSFSFQPYTRAMIGVALPYALLTPFSFASQASHLLESFYNEKNQQTFSDRINEWQIMNTWCMPAETSSAFSRLGKQVNTVHLYTCAIKLYNGYSGEDQIALYFMPRSFSIIVKKGGSLQLANMYQYKTPLDVAYYLLKTTASFEMNQSEMQLVLSGLIDESSALYNELHHYFTNIHFAHPPVFSLPPNEYPQHFFTSIFNLAACAL